MTRNSPLQTVLGVGSVAPHRWCGLVYLQHKALSCIRQATSFRQHLLGINSACLQHYQTLLHEMYVSSLHHRHASDPRLLMRASRTRYGTRPRAAPILGGLPDGPRGGDVAQNNYHQGSNGHHHRQRGHILERTALARLAADEAYMQRRRTNVQNFGSTWLKPPGLPKTLHQMREEMREQEEHQEAMRREQLAQEACRGRGRSGRRG